MVAENTAKFGKITIGLHGCELPKFSESQGSKEWWKYQKASKDDPKIQSRLLLKQTQQFWAKNDMNLLADVSHELPPSDVFKEVHVAKQGLKEIPAKINELTHCADDAFQNQVDVNPGYRNKVSWSTEIGELRCSGEDRTFDKIVKQSKAREDAEAAR